jgi:hypothetical protein
VAVCTIFLLAPLVMAVPIRGPGVSSGEALFQAISAITTTGFCCSRRGPGSATAGR